MNAGHEHRQATWPDYLKSLPLYPLPQHGISRLTYRLTRIETPWFKNLFIRWFAGKYQVNWEEALYQQPENYQHFNAFFTRPLREGARPIEGDAMVVVSPADGHISQIGEIHGDAVFQAKEHEFSVAELLGGDKARA